MGGRGDTTPVKVFAVVVKREEGTMGISFYEEPQLEKPDLIAGWPGIGNIGIIAVDTLRGLLGAEPFAEIEPWDFFYPSALSIKDGELKDLEFPSSKFYFKKLGRKDLIFFVGEEQPGEGRKNYELANLVLDVALRLGCKRVYTCGAAVAPIHHTLRPKVWAVPNSEELIAEVKRYDNTLLMSDIEGRRGQGTISGLNGLLLGVAKERGLQGICLLGEIPIYLSQFPIPYPKASRAILEVLTSNLGVNVDLGKLDDLSWEVEQNIERLYEGIPPEIRQRIDQLKYARYVKAEEPGPITEADKETIMRDIEEFFKKGGGQD